MKLWAVSRIDWSDYNLVTEFHMGETWKEALAKHSAYHGEYESDSQQWLAEMPNDLENAKQYAFDADSMIEVVEVPKE